MTVEAFAPAKVNLTLHVTGQRADGYHLLDSLVAFADVGDRLCLSEATELSMEVSGPFAKGVPTDQHNLVWKAAVGAGWTGKLDLNKHLPHGAGIGGGSSDAAALLSVLSEQGVTVPDDLPLCLGADVPVCMVAKASRMQGVGEQVTPITMPELHALLVNPGAHVPTGAVFSALDTKSNPPMPEEIPVLASVDEWAVWLQEQRNDLEKPAMEAAPVIDRVLADLRHTKGQLLSRMSGSGATCFALYPTKMAAHKAAYEVGAEHPEWWCRATVLN